MEDINKIKFILVIIAFALIVQGLLELIFQFDSDFDAKNSSKTVSLINAIYKSIETNREIKLTKNINSKKLGI